MRAIWSYPLTAEPEQTILIPRGFRTLTVNTVQGTPTLYVQVDARQADLEPVRVWSFGTGIGINIPHDRLLAYIGSYDRLEGIMTIHVFREFGTVKPGRKSVHVKST